MRQVVRLLNVALQTPSGSANFTAGRPRTVPPDKIDTSPRVVRRFLNSGEAGEIPLASSSPSAPFAPFSQSGKALTALTTAFAAQRGLNL